MLVHLNKCINVYKDIRKQSVKSTLPRETRNYHVRYHDSGL